MGRVRGVCVLGLGLIGGSVLRAAVASGRPGWGATASPDDPGAALADGYQVEPTVRDALRRAVDTDALVVLAAPLPAVDELLRAVAEVAPTCRLTDVVSVKRPVGAAVRRWAPAPRCAGAHPRAGNSVSGWPAGSATLFQRAAWVVTTDNTDDVDLWTDVARLALDCGAHVVPAATDDHDA